MSPVSPSPAQSYATSLDSQYSLPLVACLGARIQLSPYSLSSIHDLLFCLYFAQPAKDQPMIPSSVAQRSSCSTQPSC